MAAKRRYTRKDKANAVTAAVASSVMAAAEASGIPENTLRYWYDSDEFADIRAKTREELGQESKALAHRALAEINRRLGEFDPKDLSVLYGILVDKGQLLQGEATHRTETRALDAFDDHERQALHDAIRAELEGREKVEDE
jgi:hypothetical protein